MNETSAPSHSNEQSRNPADASAKLDPRGREAGSASLETSHGSSRKATRTKRTAEQLVKLQEQANQFVTVACPACGEANASSRMEKDQFTYQLCGNCRTWYLNPRPTPDLLAAYFGDPENSRYWAKQIFPATENPTGWIRQQPGLNRILDLCERFAVRKRRLVQFHAGFGEFAALAGAEGACAHVVAVEPHPELAQACRSRGVNVMQTSLQELGEDASDADVVVAFDLLARQFDPALTFRTARQVLRDRGLLIGTCPNGECFEMTALGAECDLVDPEHLNLLNPDSLTRLAEAYGFEILELTTEGGGDVDLVREAIAARPELLSGQPFLQRILSDNDPSVGQRFQQFLNENRLSTPIWFAARRRTKSR